MLDAREKPWNAAEGEIPADIYAPKGMIGPEERRCLYWLAKNTYSGRGAIVDAGAYLGASAYSLARGLSHNRSAKDGRSTIHSFDYFQVQDDYVLDSITRDFRVTAFGESFLDIFELQLGPYARFVRVHSGNFLKQRWPGEPIEILFIDLAKSVELNGHILREFFTHLIAGHSVVIHQDFYHIWHPHIHVTMEFLDDYFEVLDPLIEYQSRLYRLRKPLTSEVIDKASRYEFGVEEKRELIVRTIAKATSPMREMAEAILLYQAVLDDDREAFERKVEGFKALHPDFGTCNELWAHQAVRVMAAAQQRGWRV
jgi:hypothetical protein